MIAKSIAPIGKATRPNMPPLTDMLQRISKLYKLKPHRIEDGGKQLPVHTAADIQIHSCTKDPR